MLTMKVRLTLRVLLLSVLLVNQAEAEIVEISVYDNDSKQGVYSLKNSSDDSAGTTRAMSSGNIFHGLLMKPENSGARSSHDSFKTPKYIVYPSNSQAVYPQQPWKDAMAADRSVPGEAYGGTIYKILKAKQEKRKGYQYNKPNVSSSGPPSPPVASSPTPTAPSLPPQPLPLITGPTPLPSTAPANPSNPTDNLSDAPTPEASPPIPPTDPNLFAPNIQSHYPPSPANGETRFNGNTAAGPVADDPSTYSNLPDSPPPNQYIPPAELFQLPPNIHSHYHPPPMNNHFPLDGLTSYFPPPTGPSDNYLNTGLKDMMPLGPPMSGPPMDNPFDFHGYEHNHPHDHSPEYIFDHDHDHDHHDYPPPTTTPAPPPPPPPEMDRVKNYNYNYYYIARFLWYSPLYFTIYIGFYILILLMRGIGRHVVKYPNQYTANSRDFGSLHEMRFLTNEQASYKADVMAQFVMKQIDDFKQKHKR